MSFWHCNCCKLQLQVALSFQQVLQLLRMLSRFSNHFLLIIRQCSAGRKDRRSAVNLLCFTLLLCHCAASSYCAAFAAAPLALLSLFAAQPSPLPAMCSSAVASLSPSLSSTSSLCSALSFAHHVRLLLLQPRALLLRSRCRCRCPCSLSATLFVVIIAISCALV